MDAYIDTGDLYFHVLSYQDTYLETEHKDSCTSAHSIDCSDMIESKNWELPARFLYAAARLCRPY